MNRIAKTQEDLRNELTDQINFLIKSSLLFDKGDFSEAKRMSTGLRNLLYDGGMSKSLLGQLFQKNEFPSYYKDINGKFSTQRNFIISTLLNNAVHQYCPNFASGLADRRMLIFEEWWNQKVISDYENNSFTRRDIILAVAQTDGGSHVDPNLDENYFKLSRQNSQQSFIVDIEPDHGLPTMIPQDKMKPSLPPVWHTLRQIAHEIIEFKAIPYNYKPHDYYTGEIVIGFDIS